MKILLLARGETVPLRGGLGRTVRALAGSGLAVVEALRDASISIA